MKYTVARTAAAILSLAALAACDQLDPLSRPYSWVPGNINSLNIASMAANPADLTRGRHTDQRRSQPDADSVDRLFNGKAAAFGSGGAGGSGGTGGGGGGGGGVGGAGALGGGN